MGLPEFEAIDNPIMILGNVNPKEYYEYYRSKDSNKKHKSVHKGTIGMTFEVFFSRILSLTEAKIRKN